MQPAAVLLSSPVALHSTEGMLLGILGESLQLFTATDQCTGICCSGRSWIKLRGSKKIVGRDDRIVEEWPDDRYVGVGQDERSREDDDKKLRSTTPNPKLQTPNEN